MADSSAIPGRFGPGLAIPGNPVAASGAPVPLLLTAYTSPAGVATASTGP